jgi:hypothetical protein
MRKKIKNEQFLSTLFISGFHIGMCIYWSMTQKNWRRLLFLTWWSLYLNSVFLIAILICDSILFFTKKTFLEKINFFFRNYYSSISISFSYFVTLIYWSLIYVGSGFQMGKNLNDVLHNIYIHLLVSIFLTIDVFVAKREKKDFNSIEFSIIYLILIIYMIFYLIGKFEYNQNVYSFTNEMTKIKIIIYFIIFSVVIFFSYEIYIFFVNEANEENEDKNYINEIHLMLNEPLIN